MRTSNDELEYLARIHKALGHPIRLRLYLDFLEHYQATGSDTCEMDDDECWRDYAESLGIAASTLSHHLKELTNADLIKIQRNGQRRLAQLNARGIQLLQPMLTMIPTDLS